MSTYTVSQPATNTTTADLLPTGLWDYVNPPGWTVDVANASTYQITFNGRTIVYHAHPLSQFSYSVATGVLIPDGGFFNSISVMAGSNTIAQFTIPAGSFAVSSLADSTTPANLFAGMDTLTGNIGSNTLVGYAGDDQFLGIDGADLLYGGNDSDTFTYTTAGNTILVAGSVIDGGTGGTDIDTIAIDSSLAGAAVSVDFRNTSMASIESLFFKTGSGASETTAVFSSSQFDTIFDNSNAVSFNATVNKSGPAAANLIFNVTNGGMFDISSVTFSGWGASDRITIDGGSATSDLIIGGSSQNETIIGGAGDDVISETGYTVFGTYRPMTAVDLEFEEFLVSPTGNDIIFGNDGNDVIRGSEGVDQLYGGSGSDTFYFNQHFINYGNIIPNVLPAGTVIDGGTAGSNFDTIAVGVQHNQQVLDFRLAAITSIESIKFVANPNDPLDPFGTKATDRMIISSSQIGNGQISSTAFIDNHNGNGFSELKFMMTNGGNINLSGFTFAAWFNELVLSPFYPRPSNIFVVQDFITIDGSATTLASTIVGTSQYDTITGGSGNNIISGLAGNDSLDGRAGHDTLTGGLGVDTFIGGLGNDTFVVESQAEAITELLNQGTDSVHAGFTYSLATKANVENLLLTGTAAINGTGNALANTLTGNAGANTLDGGTDALADTLIGGLGNDSYVIRSATDNITEAAGGGIADRAKAALSFSLAAGDNIEFLETVLATATTAINLTGNEIAQTIIGNAGTNILNGGLGNDILTGGVGSDAFVFNTALSATLNRDTITDFNVVADTIRLENAVFNKLVGVGTMSAVQFHKGAGVTTSHDLNDRIIYNTTTGALYYDADGNKAGGVAAIQFATLTGSPDTVTNADFFII